MGVQGNGVTARSSESVGMCAASCATGSTPGDIEASFLEAVKVAVGIGAGAATGTKGVLSATRDKPETADSAESVDTGVWYVAVGAIIADGVGIGGSINRGDADTCGCFADATTVDTGSRTGAVGRAAMGATFAGGKVVPVAAIACGFGTRVGNVCRRTTVVGPTRGNVVFGVTVDATKGVGTTVDTGRWPCATTTGCARFGGVLVDTVGTCARDAVTTLDPMACFGCMGATTAGGRWTGAVDGRMGAVDGRMVEAAVPLVARTTAVVGTIVLLMGGAVDGRIGCAR
ncbi:hypothetical protein TW95_gp1836 [Pandoravirus inopinatum]|uniref:Uncharacterized protein n=1 Tax=Pandoravirus inopinatum TaxID=1605721 RepID=A0A0B5J9A7_9VIRU|nr:hypothetical protein TW95_gp1836 [Pandoravirus inopinatum]AJF98570.1 hypothetical protein [Pandoravirus inopinatum]